MKGTSIDQLSHYEEKEFVSQFIEDYNTATFPHKKQARLHLTATQVLQPRQVGVQKQVEDGEGASTMIIDIDL